jgi:hypothetical protein
VLVNCTTAYSFRLLLCSLLPGQALRPNCAVRASASCYLSKADAREDLILKVLILLGQNGRSRSLGDAMPERIGSWNRHSARPGLANQVAGDFEKAHPASEFVGITGSSGTASATRS